MRGESEEVFPQCKAVLHCHKSNRMIGQLDNVQGFIQKWNYPNQQSTLDAEWGTVANCRFLLSSIGSVTPNASLLGADVYNIFVCGRESFAAIEQDGYSAQFIKKIFGFFKKYVNFKSLLIDLEARWGDKGQAVERFAA